MKKSRFYFIKEMHIGFMCACLFIGCYQVTLNTSAEEKESISNTVDHDPINDRSGEIVTIKPESSALIADDKTEVMDGDFESDSTVPSRETISVTSSTATKKEEIKVNGLVSPTDRLLDVLISLVCVILLIFFMAAMFRRYGAGQVMRADQGIEIKQMHALGQKERLIVVEVYGKSMLLGVTNNSINHLCNFSQEDIQSKEQNSSEKKNSEFFDIKRKVAAKINRWYSEKGQSGYDPSFKKMLDKELKEAKAKRVESQRQT